MKVLGQFHSWHSRCVSRPDLAYVVCCQFGVRTGLTRRNFTVPTLAHHVGDVIGLSALKEVLESATRWIVTSVKDLFLRPLSGS